MKRKNYQFFNEEETLKSLYKRAHHEGLSLDSRKEEHFMKKSWLKMGAVLALAASFVFAYTQLNPQITENEGIVEVISEKAVVAYISIDINPSFELAVCNDDTVKSIEQLNDDALSIDVSDLIGMDVDLAIEAIVARATEAGFIDLEDTVEDYVVITSVMEDGISEQIELQLRTKIEERLQISETLSSVKVVSIKADMVAKFEAEEKEVPVGLYVINGGIAQEDGTYLSVKEVFANENSVNELKNTYQINITELSLEQLTLTLQNWLEQLEAAGVDVSSYEAQMIDADINELVTLHDTLKETYTDLLSDSQLNQSENANPEGEKPEDAGNSSENAGQSEAGSSQSSGSGKKN